MWSLPHEILQRILVNISFDDYVALSQTNRAFNHILNHKDTWAYAFHNYYGKLHEEHGVNPEPAAMKEMWMKKVRLRAFLEDLYEKSAGLTIEEKLGSYEFSEWNDRWSELTPWTFLLNRGINMFTTDDYFLTVITVFREEKVKVRQLLEENTVPLTPFAFLSKVVEIHNFTKATRFFSTVSPDSSEDQEHYYFELARYDGTLHALLKTRIDQLESMRSAIANLLPIRRGVLGFQSMDAFHGFLATAVQLVLQFVIPQTTSSRGTILNVYSGCHVGHTLMYLAIASKILQEEIFLKLQISIGKRKTQILAKCSLLFLIIGDVYVHVLVDVKKLYVKAFLKEGAASRVLAGQDRRDLKHLMPATMADIVIQQIEHPSNFDEMDHTVSVLATNNWSETPVHTMHRRKYLLAKSLLKLQLLEERTEVLELSSLFMYFVSLLDLDQEGDHEASLRNHIHGLLKKDGEQKSEFPPGSIFVNTFQGTFGVVLRSTNNKSHLVFPADADTVTENYDVNMEKISLDVFAEHENLAEFLEWFLKSESTKTLCLLAFSQLKITEGVPIFVK